MSYTSVLDTIKRGDIQPVYALVGEEDYFKNEVIGTLRKHLFPDPGASFDYETLYPSAITAAEIVNKSQTLPFAAPMRLMVIYDADQLVSTAPERECMLDYVKRPADTTCLVLCAAKLNATTSFYKLLQKKNALLKCERLSFRETPSWIEEELRSKWQKAVTKRAVCLLAESIGVDLHTLSREIEKVALFAGEKTKVDIAEVKAVATVHNLSTSYDFINALFMRNKGQALSFLLKLLDSGEEIIRLLGLIRFKLEQIALGNELLQQGKNVAAIKKQLRIHYYAETFFSQLKQFSRQDIIERFAFLLEADRSLKSTTTPPQLIMELLTVSFCG